MADLQTRTEATLVSTSVAEPDLTRTIPTSQSQPQPQSPSPSIPQTNGFLSNGITPTPTPTSTPAEANNTATPPSTTSTSSEPKLPAYAAAISDAADLDETPLFSPLLISDDIKATLPTGYSIRPLRRSDYFGGYLPTLRVLTTVGEPTQAEFNARYDFISSRNDTYYILVICDESDTVVGTGAVIVERKFIHNMGLVGHIEDIAVAKNQQGKKLGLRVIQALDSVAEKVGCYKSILDCSEANEGFYVKCGFKRAGLEMAHYYEAVARI
ncbi:glucosamine-phosphate N-acetyltransferase [Exophiala aquamarina CBS 119918]|uniref:Glucosamine 6-phosphate N-acetyltransferase n=1 Tax=Exophiala aquamarina CBS 119918 TaxID=1182545 RepID=A0A072PNT3_9EURO|nr:glucosamine-phosphate N-acetyltransferase [Exophiala aquamarina CBS 119918]KEF61729.1 glucosamine-phosphate N-acetyltransferase [Exophiala aquamarina CBS 119918]